MIVHRLYAGKKLDKGNKGTNSSKYSGNKFTIHSLSSRNSQLSKQPRQWLLTSQLSTDLRKSIPSLPALGIAAFQSRCSKSS